MRRLAALILLAVVAAACSDSDPVVASVNGRDIRQSDVLELRDRPEDVATADADAFRRDLGRIIIQEVVASSGQAEFGIVVTGDEVLEEISSMLAEFNVTVEEAISQLNDPDATEALLRRNIYAFLLVDRIQLELASSDEFLNEVLAESPGAVTAVCASHLLVETEAEAIAASERLAAGEDFATLAGELSLDSAPGGDLGCSLAERFVPEFADAAMAALLDEVVGPVQTDFGWHLILVRERDAPTIQEIKVNPRNFLPQDLISSEFTVWMNEKVKEAVVDDIDPKIGFWSPIGLGLLPPDAELSE